jgi:glycosyltransferase involved in cell wall biosynthesis
MIDLLYVSFNRLEYTRRSFTQLLKNTDWSLVARLFLADDGSEDGTREWLEDAAAFDVDMPAEFLPSPFGGPVAAANLYLDHATPGVETFAKIDNDTVTPPGWLPEMLRLMDEHPEIDLLGMAPRIGPPQPCPYPERGIEYAPWVDGNGLWRHRTFDEDRPTPEGGNGRFGFTEWQGNREQIIKAWATPDLPVFQLDGLPFEPWLSLAERYVQNGWQRRWPTFDPDATAYWDWYFAAETVTR